MKYFLFLLCATSFLNAAESIEIAGTKLSYTPQIGAIPVKLGDDKESTEAAISYIAYFKQNAAPRPLVFCFNGGPGSSSVWLHIGLLGPYAINSNQLKPNHSTLLANANLVFVDPVGTGLSQPPQGVDPKPFYSVEGDIDSLSQFIRDFLTLNECWSSPIYLIGESYGGLRAIGIAAKLKEQFHIDTQGLVLISPAIDVATLDEEFLLTQILQFPTFALTAQHYNRCAKEHQTKSREELYAEVVEFAKTHYATALLKGTSLDDESKKNLYAQLSSYTGIAEADIAQHQGKISPAFFEEYLFEKNGITTGRFDTRITAPLLQESYLQPDPSINVISGVFTATFNDYLRAKLKCGNKSPYTILQGLPWVWAHGQRTAGLGYLSLQDTLAKLFVILPNFRLLLLSGYFDGATPIATQHYALDQLSPTTKKRVISYSYEGGHMMYLTPEIREQVNSAIHAFVK